MITEKQLTMIRQTWTLKIKISVLARSVMMNHLIWIRSRWYGCEITRYHFRLSGKGFMNKYYIIITQFNEITKAYTYSSFLVIKYNTLGHVLTLLWTLRGVCWKFFDISSWSNNLVDDTNTQCFTTVHTILTNNK